MYTLLDDYYNKTGGKVVMDSTFASVNSDAIIKSSDDYTSARSACDLLQKRPDEK